MAPWQIILSHLAYGAIAAGVVFSVIPRKRKSKPLDSSRDQGPDTDRDSYTDSLAAFADTTITQFAPVHGGDRSRA